MQIEDHSSAPPIPLSIRSNGVIVKGLARPAGEKARTAHPKEFDVFVEDIIRETVARRDDGTWHGEKHHCCDLVTEIGRQIDEWLSKPSG